MSIVNIGSPRSLTAAAGSGAISSGATVLGGTWASAADLMNWLTGHGGQLICANSPNVPITAGGSATLRYYTWPRLVARHHLWIVYATAAAGTRTKISLVSGSESASVHRLGAYVGSGGTWNQYEDPPSPFFHVSTITPSATPGELTLTVNVTGENALIYSVACVELPRTRLLIGSTDNAAAYAGPGFAIYQANESGLYGVAQACESGRDDLIRSNFHWYDPTGFTTTSTSYTAVFQLPPTVIGRAGSAADGVTIDVTVAARLNVTGAATGELLVTAASGDTVTLSTTSTTAGWITGTLTIDREDLSPTDTNGVSGREIGDTLTFELRRTGGTSVTVTGIAVGEP